MPCAIASGLDIGLSNSSLKTITLAFYSKISDEHLSLSLIKRSPITPAPALVTPQCTILQLLYPNSHVQVILACLCAALRICFQAGETDVDTC